MKPSVILMGSKPGSVVALSILLKRDWNVKYVVVSGNHPWVAGQTLGDLAAAHNIKVVTQKELPTSEVADFVISYMYRNLVKPTTLAMAKRAALNFHAGPLPEFGGFAFYNSAILENSPEYGCTCHYMDAGFDTGPLFKVRRFPINALQETAFSLERKAQQEMIRLFVDFCNIVETHESLPIEEQDKSKFRYMTREEFEKLKEIPVGADELTIDRYARAFWSPPYPGAYINLEGIRVEVIPNIVKSQLAEMLHIDDLTDLQKTASEYDKEFFS